MPLNSPDGSAKVLARTLYDGSGAPAQRDILVEVEDGLIVQAGPWRRGAQMAGVQEQAIVCPGLIDLQINGANDVQFNDTPTPEALARMAEGAARGGTAWIMPTFITAPGQDYLAAMDAARRAIRDGVPGILGLHLEGPFISPRRPGIHDRAAIRPMESGDLAALMADFPGPLLLTVAPEEQPPGAIAHLTGHGIIVFAGHSEATSAQIDAASRDGLSGATHLFNAMSQMAGRGPGVVGAVLGSDRLFAGIIADGQHVDWTNIAIAARLMPHRLCLVTDAMCTLAGKRTEFDLHGERIRLCDGRLQNADGTLAGAHVAMDESIRNAIAHAIAGPESVVRMATGNPAAALGLGDRLGRIAPGFASGLTLLDDDWRACGVIHGRMRRT